MEQDPALFAPPSNQRFRGTEHRETQYLIFELSGLRKKTACWIVRSKSTGAVLAEIAWFGRWRQYTADPRPDTTFNRGCLLDIANFLGDLNAEQRKGLHAQE